MIAQHEPRCSSTSGYRVALLQHPVIRHEREAGGYDYDIYTWSFEYENNNIKLN